MSESAVIPLPSQLPVVKKDAGFKRLKMKHRRIIALHLDGCSNVEIAVAMDANPAYISNVLNDPLVQKFLEDAYKDFDQEIKALTPGAIAAVRRNLDCGEGKLELKAADMAFKVNHRYAEKDDARQTAEDVIERMVERLGPDGSRLRYTEKRFLKQSGGKEE
jgi:hypothetical protein